jgi:hypothetical protein
MARTEELILPAVTAEEWNGAYRRVGAYLSALGVRHEFLLYRLVQQVMDRCAARIEAGDSRDVAQAATAEVERQVLDWFRAVLGIESSAHSNCDPDEISLRGRLAMLLAEMPAYWHGVFLTDPPWPEEFVQAVRSSYLEAVPALSMGRMDCPPLDLGRVPQLADKALCKIDRTPWLRLFLLWAAFAALFGFVFWFTR